MRMDAYHFQLFDDGHLTDSHGRKGTLFLSFALLFLISSPNAVCKWMRKPSVDFRNVIVVMTSNIGAHVIAELPSNLTGSEPAVQETLMDVVRGTLSPELLKCVV